MVIIRKGSAVVDTSFLGKGGSVRVGDTTIKAGARGPTIISGSGGSSRTQTISRKSGPVMITQDNEIKPENITEKSLRKLEQQDPRAATIIRQNLINEEKQKSFGQRIFEKKGYVVTKENGRLVAIKGNEKVVISNEGFSITPKSAKTSKNFLKDLEQQRELQREKNKQIYTGDLPQSVFLPEIKPIRDEKGKIIGVRDTIGKRSVFGGDIKEIKRLRSKERLLKKQLEKKDLPIFTGEQAQSIFLPEITPIFNDKGEIVGTRDGVGKLSILGAKPEEIKKIRSKQLLDQAKKVLPSGNIIKRVGAGFFEFIKDVAVGLRNNVEAGQISVNQLKKGKKVISEIVKSFALIKKYEDIRKKRKLSNKELNILKKQADKLRDNKKDLNNLKIKAAVGNALVNSAESRIALITGTFFVGGSLLGSVAGIVGLATRLGINVLGKVIVTKEIFRTIREPTPENFGRLSFYALSDMLYILNTIRKLSPKFIPTAKNVRTARNTLLEIRRINKGLLNDAVRQKDVKARNKIRKQNLEIEKSLKRIDFYLKNEKDFVMARDFNPVQHSRLLKKLQGLYNAVGYHVTPAKARKLFGQKVEKDIVSRKKILETIKKSVGEIKELPKSKIGSLSTKTVLDKLVLRNFIENGVVLGGGKALNLRVPLLRKRFTSDIDAKVLGNNAKSILEKIVKQANSILSVKEKIFLTSKFGKKVRYEVKAGGNPGTYKIVDRSNNKILVELTNSKKKIPFSLNKQGLRVETKKGLIFGKADSLSKLQRFKRKGFKDIKDVVRLTGKIKPVFKLVGEKVLPVYRNASRVFEVVIIKSGMGKSRLKFGETHFYMDFESALGYAQGKKYTIIKFPFAKISKYPKKFQKRINLASQGKLSVKEQTKLRKDLNKYIKANPNKFFLSPRAIAQGIGEREIVLAVGSKFIKKNVWKTFDNDLQSFIKIIEVGFNNKKKISLYKTFMRYYKNNPFKKLKARLSNPDLLQVRKIKKIIDNDLRVTLKQKNVFQKIFDKLVGPFKGKKGSFKFSKNKLSTEKDTLKDVKKDINKLNKFFDVSQKKVKTLAQGEKLIDVYALRYKRLLKRLKNLKVSKKTIKDLEKKSRINIRKKRRIVKRKVSPIKIRGVIKRKVGSRVIKRKPKSRREIVKRKIKSRVIKRKPKSSRKIVKRVPKRRKVIKRKVPSRKRIVERKVKPRVGVPPRRPVRPFVPGKPPTKQKAKLRKLSREEEKKIKKKLEKQLLNRRFVYLPDLDSIISDKRVNKAKKRKDLLAVGRVFSGLESRGIV